MGPQKLADQKALRLSRAPPVNAPYPREGLRDAATWCLRRPNSPAWWGAFWSRGSDPCAEGCWPCWQRGNNNPQLVRGASHWMTGWRWIWMISQAAWRCSWMGIARPCALIRREIARASG